MQRFIQIIQSLHPSNQFGEIYHSLDELAEYLNNLQIKQVVVEDCIITPYYICNGKRLELYEFELNISIEKRVDFKSYILKKTGRNTMDSIPPEIVTISKNCYIGLENYSILESYKILNYIEFVNASSSLKEQVLRCFDDFNTKNLYFLTY